MLRSALLVLVTIVLTSCSGTATLTPTPSGQEPTNPAPTSSPSATPADHALPPLTLLESTVDGLRLREGPGLAEDAFVFQCNPAVGCDQPVVVNAGWMMLAFAGPVAADGYDWYLVQLRPAHPGSPYLGWAATPQSGDPWLIPAEYECLLEVPDLDAAIAIGSVTLVYCYGDEPLSFEGYVVKGFGCSISGDFEPEWLAHPCANMSYISPVASSDGDGRLFLHYPAPGVTNPTLDLDAGQLVRITGHFDDPAATTCVMDADGLTAGDAAAAVARCRVRFAVSEVAVLPGP